MALWTDDMRKRAFELCEQRMSATKIAAVLGNGISRNAVLGLLYRANKHLGVRPGMSFEQQTQRLAKAEAKVAKPAKPVIIKPPARPLIDGPKLPKTMEELRTVEVASLHIGLMDLTERTCRWPTIEVDGAHKFCGLQCGQGPYCTSHTALAYQPRVENRKGYVKPFQRERRAA
jgi:GcrA cell cycle regulator